MSLSTYEPIAVVTRRTRDGLEIETYQSPLALIMSLMNSGTVGGGCYGTIQHRAALRKIEKHLAFVREQIKRHNQEQNV